jgi:hypothetical protein
MKEQDFPETTVHVSHSREYVVPDDRNIYLYCILIIVINTLKPVTLSTVQVMLEQWNIAHSIIKFLLFQNAQLLSQLHPIMFTIFSPTHTQDQVLISSFRICLLKTKVVCSLEHFDKKYE